MQQIEDKIELKFKELNLYYDSDDIKKLSSKVAYLKNNDLEKMTERLFEQNKAPKFLETLTEVNFAFQLLSSLPINTFKAYYEPINGARPIDLILKYKEKKYSIQIKYLSSSIRTNKQNKVVAEIKKQSKEIKANRGFLLQVSANFSIDHVSELMKFIKSNLNKKDDEPFFFKKINGVSARIEFQTPKNKVRKYLALYLFSNISAVDVTNEIKEQVKSALQNAAGAFEINSTTENVNLIVSEIISSDRNSIDFAEALYGTEYTFYDRDLKSYRRSRNDDGLFQQENFTKKVSAIIVVHRKKASLISDYEQVICLNPAYDHISTIKDLIDDKIIERYTWIKKSFF